MWRLLVLSQVLTDLNAEILIKFILFLSAIYSFVLSRLQIYQLRKYLVFEDHELRLKDI